MVMVVGVPRLAMAVVDLDESHSAFRQSSSQEAAVGKMAVAVSLSDGGWLVLEMERLGRFELHAVGRLHRLNPALQGGGVGGVSL